MNSIRTIFKCLALFCLISMSLIRTQEAIADNDNSVTIEDQKDNSISLQEAEELARVNGVENLRFLVVCVASALPCRKGVTTCCSGTCANYGLCL